MGPDDDDDDEFPADEFDDVDDRIDCDSDERGDPRVSEID